MAIAKAAGFVISEQELKRAQPEISEEEELAGVSGGGLVDPFGFRESFREKSDSILAEREQERRNNLGIK